MSKQDNGGPAFPATTEQAAWFPGMTLRDYFAAHAPEPPRCWRDGDRRLPDVIEWRWYYADAMLKAREE